MDEFAPKTYQHFALEQWLGLYELRFPLLKDSLPRLSDTFDPFLVFTILQNEVSASLHNILMMLP